MNHYSDLCWEMIFAELRYAAIGQLDSPLSSVDNDDNGDVVDEENGEKEKSWRCSNAIRRRSLVRTWMKDPELVLRNDIGKVNCVCCFVIEHFADMIFF